jgi:hypothetical protein
LPSLDLTELLNDPDLAGESFTVLRREQVITSQGRGSVQTSTFTAVGSVIPLSDQPMQRGPDQQTLPRLLQVITQFRLRGVSKDPQGNDYQPDLIVWNGDNYVVNKVYDWSHYGAGFVSADCSSIVSVEEAPQ